MKKIILLDGDILVYQIGFSVESPVYVVNGKTYRSKKIAETKAKGQEIHKRKNIGSIKDLLMNLQTKMKTIFEDCETDDYRMFITASKVKQNFRSEVATFLPYKGNRLDVEKPFYYNRIREILVNDYKAELIEGQEADDQIGIEQYKLFKQFGNFENSIIASIDKDLRVLPGYHYHLGNRNMGFVEEEQGYKNFYGQLLKGDYTDNIPGLTRLLKIHGREEEANKLSYSRYLKRFEEFCIDHTPKQCYDYVREQYAKYGYGNKEIQEIGQLLWIRREENEVWQC